MEKLTKLFMNIKKQQEWLSQQKGRKLVHTNGIKYRFEKSFNDYNYEFVYFNKGKKELNQIRQQIQDEDIEFVCSNSTWCLFRKDSSKGDIHVYIDNYDKYKILMKKYDEYMALGACYMCLGSTQVAISTTGPHLFGLTSVLFYLCSILFFLYAARMKKYANDYDDGTYAIRRKKEK